MSMIDITDGQFIINGTSSTVVAKSLKTAGLADSVIAEIVGGWFVGVTGATTPTAFRFTTDVEDVDAACTVDYERSFAHTDWIDGESRVQAGMTPEELGFNARFHAIENEFDAIEEQFGSLGTCVANLRSDLAGIVGELEAKLTAMQNQIHALQQAGKTDTGPTILGTATIGGKDAFVTKFGDDFRFVEFQTNPIVTTNPRPGGKLFVPDEYIEIERMSELILETEKLLGGPEFEELFERNEPVTIGELRRTASDVVLPSGVVLGAVMADLPADTTFGSAGEAVAEIVGGLVGALPKDGVAELRREVLTADATTRTGGALLNSGISAVVTDAEVADAVGSVGFNTVGKLSTAGAATVVTAVRNAGLDVNEAAVERAVAKAVIGRAIRNIGIGG
jgi:hypothetical protein